MSRAETQHVPLPPAFVLTPALRAAVEQAQVHERSNAVIAFACGALTERLLAARREADELGMLMVLDPGTVPRSLFLRWLATPWNDHPPAEVTRA